VGPTCQGEKEREKRRVTSGRVGRKMAGPQGWAGVAGLGWVVSFFLFFSFFQIHFQTF
jgi:hypothetical protein